MSFNYRIIQNFNDHELANEDERIWYAVYEVYYDESGKPIASSKEPVYPYGNNLSEFKESVDMYMEALNKNFLKIIGNSYIEIK